MKEDYLLNTDGARRLYQDFAKDLPIIDYHNHVCVADLAADRQYESLFELWLAADPYKHRLMRICGVAEHFITGDAAPFEKFRKYSEILPFLAGNPVYDWSRMELSRVFGIDTPLTGENAKYVYDQCNEMLRSKEFSARGILAGFGIEYQSPVATLTEDLSCFDGVRVAPSLRGDDLLAPTSELTARLAQLTGIETSGTDGYLRAVALMLDRFHAKGCRVADHALDADFFEREDTPKRVELLTRLGNEYAKRGWTLLLHLGAHRSPSPRLARIAGPAGGYAAVGGRLDIGALCTLLGKMEQGGLPDTVLFPLNMSDQAPLAVLQGSFSQDGHPSKVQLGAAWWWCDHAQGIRSTLDAIASFGAVSQFIGMTTDSRSLLSFVRHDYFRRILCAWLDERNARDELDIPPATMGEIVRKICYENAKEKIRR